MPGAFARAACFPRQGVRLNASFPRRPFGKKAPPSQHTRTERYQEAGAGFEGSLLSDALVSVSASDWGGGDPTPPQAVPDSLRGRRQEACFPLRTAWEVRLALGWGAAEPRPPASSWPAPGQGAKAFLARASPTAHACCSAPCPERFMILAPTFTSPRTTRKRAPCSTPPGQQAPDRAALRASPFCCPPPRRPLPDCQGAGGLTPLPLLFLASRSAPTQAPRLWGWWAGDPPWPAGQTADRQRGLLCALEAGQTQSKSKVGRLGARRPQQQAGVSPGPAPGAGSSRPLFWKSPQGSRAAPACAKGEGDGWFSRRGRVCREPPTRLVLPNSSPGAGGSRLLAPTTLRLE